MDFTVRIVLQNLVTPSNFVEFRDSGNFTFFEARRVTSDTWHMLDATLSHVSNGEERSNSLRGGHVSPPKRMEVQIYG